MKHVFPACNGSILVMIMLVMTVVVILATNVVLSTNFMMDIARARVEQEQQYRTAQGLLNYGIALCMKNDRALLAAKKSGKKEATFTIEQLPSAPGHTYKGTVTLIPKGKAVQVKGVLVHNNTPIYQMLCKLTRSERKEQGKQPSWVIDDWDVYKPSRKSGSFSGQSPIY